MRSSRPPCAGRLLPRRVSRASLDGLRRRPHRGDAGVGKVLQHLLHLRVLADRFDLARLARAALRPSGSAPSSPLTATIQTRPVQAFSLRISSWPSSRGAVGSGLISRCPGRKCTRRTCSSSACFSFKSRFASASATRSSKLLRSATGAGWRAPMRGSATGAGSALRRARACGGIGAGDGARRHRCSWVRRAARRHRPSGASGRPAAADRRRRRAAPAPCRRRRAAAGSTRTSSWPLSSICQARASTGMESRAASSVARARSASLAEASAASAPPHLDGGSRHARPRRDRR